MKEFWLDFQCTVHAKDEDELHEIIARLKRALGETEWKVTDIECSNIEEA